MNDVLDDVLQMIWLGQCASDDANEQCSTQTCDIDEGACSTEGVARKQTEDGVDKV